MKAAARVSLQVWLELDQLGKLRIVHGLIVRVSSARAALGVVNEQLLALLQRHPGRQYQ